MSNAHDIIRMYNNPVDFLFPAAQFWNIGVSMEKYNGTLRSTDPSDDVYIITITRPEGESRTFPAWKDVKVG